MAKEKQEKDVLEKKKAFEVEYVINKTMFMPIKDKETICCGRKIDDVPGYEFVKMVGDNEYKIACLSCMMGKYKRIQGKRGWVWIEKDTKTPKTKN